MKARACAANSSTRGSGTTSQPSAMRAARAMPAGTWEPIRIGGRGDWVGRGRIVTFSKVQCRPRWVTLSSVQSRRMISTPSARRLTRSAIGTPKIANSSGR